MVELEWIFLVYVGRSGSTFFANQLAKATSQLLVLPESKIVDLLLGIDADNFLAMSAARKLETVKKDPRWANMHISDAEFMAVCKDHQSARQLLNDLACYLAERVDITPSHVLVKNVAIAWNHKNIFSAFPKAQFLHVCRDARGSTASRMNKIPVYKDKAGARLSDPWFLAKHWVRYIERIEHLKNEGLDVYQVSYEDIMLNSENSVNRCLTYFNIVRRSDGKNAFRLSEKEASGKHVNVNLPPISLRVQAWKTELSHDDGVLIELLCSNYISDLYFRNRTTVFTDFTVFFKSYIRHLYLTTRRIIERSFT